MASNKPLEGKIAIVTGASRGIGRAIALQLAKEGTTLVLAARTKTDLDKVASEINSSGGKATSVAGDLRDPGVPAEPADRRGPGTRGGAPPAGILGGRACRSGAGAR